MEYTVVLSIAGSDCSGGAGIQADIKTLSALGCYAVTVVTSVTAQNTLGVRSAYPIPADVVAAQLQAVAEDLRLSAVKIGMVTDASVISVVGDFLERHDILAIFDPVLVSSSGFPLVDPEATALLADRLLPRCLLLTPNIPEAEIFSGMRIRRTDDMVRAARRIRRQGGHSVLVKGGHLQGDDMADVLVTGNGPEDVFYFRHTRIASRNTHGTGCTLSSAIAAYVARQFPLPEAVRRGKEYLVRALSAGKDVSIGKGHGPLNHFFSPEKLIIK